MNGLIPKRSCVNPVLITTFGLEPSGPKAVNGATIIPLIRFIII